MSQDMNADSDAVALATKWWKNKKKTELNSMFVAAMERRAGDRYVYWGEEHHLKLDAWFKELAEEGVEILDLDWRFAEDHRYIRPVTNYRGKLRPHFLEGKMIRLPDEFALKSLTLGYIP